MTEENTVEEKSAAPEAGTGRITIYQILKLVGISFIWFQMFLMNNNLRNISEYMPEFPTSIIISNMPRSVSVSNFHEINFGPNDPLYIKYDGGLAFGISEQ